MTPLDLAKSKPAAFRPGFLVWLAENGHIWTAFRRESDKAWSRGRRHYSARTVIEYLRHETMIAQKAGAWKIDGNNVADLARLYLLTYPNRAGFFETRSR